MLSISMAVIDTIFHSKSYLNIYDAICWRLITFDGMAFTNNWQIYLHSFDTGDLSLSYFNVCVYIILVAIIIIIIILLMAMIIIYILTNERMAYVEYPMWDFYYWHCNSYVHSLNEFEMHRFNQYYTNNIIVIAIIILHHHCCFCAHFGCLIDTYMYMYTYFINIFHI